VVALKRGVGNLVDVEHVPIEIGGQVRQGRRHTEPANFALGAHVLQRVDQLTLFALGDRRVVELHYVDRVDAQALKAFMQAAEEVLSGPDMPVGMAAALGGQYELVAAVA